MRQIFFVTFALLIFSATAFASDVWILTEYSGRDKCEWYVQPERIVEDFDKKTFDVPLILVINDKFGDNRRQTFSLVGYVWYVKPTNSGQSPQEVNSRELYQKMFDACIPNCKLAQTYPR